MFYRFACQNDKHTAMLKDLQDSIEAARFSNSEHQALALPVKLKVHESVFVPAKWAMLMAGNWCSDAMRPIQSCSS